MTDMTVHVRQRFAPSHPMTVLFKDAQHCAAIRTSQPILGIDGSVAKAGFCLAFGNQVKAWVFNPRGTGVQRLMAIDDEIARLCKQYSIFQAVIEGYSLGSRNTNAQSTGEAGGVMRLRLARQGVTLHEASPNTLKKFLSGKGNSPKSSMPMHLLKRYGVEYGQEDEADATGLAILGAALLGQHDKELFDYQRDALNGVIRLNPPEKKMQRVAKGVDKENPVR